jgi:hypothetical protein
MLRKRAADSLSRAQFIAGRYEELAPMCAQLGYALKLLEEPMRVAIAGLIKRGKSTLSNALLGADVAPTGTEETTFNVVEFQYGDEPAFEVHFKSGQVDSFAGLLELHRYVARQANLGSALADVERIYVSYPNPLLRTFRLLDLPGLGSVFEDDSLNAMERLGITQESVTAASVQGVDQADAVVYLFNRALAVSDADIVREFSGEALERLTPIKAIGVLSRVDDYWPPQPRRGEQVDALSYEPLQRARLIIDRYVGDTRAADIFYDIKPVIAKLAVGAASATEADFEALQVLSTLKPELRVRQLRDAQRFARAELTDIPLDRPHRARLVELLGVYGINLATRLMGDGLGADEVRRELSAHSGVNDVRNSIVSHFGNRADLIKLAGILTDLDAECRRLRPGLRGGPAEALADIGKITGRLRATEHGFRELDALHLHYKLRADRRRGSGTAELNASQAEEFLQVTGEHGLSCAARLGCPPSATVQHLLEVAASRLRYWRTAAVDPTIDRELTPLVEFLCIAYELLWHHVREAQRHLAFEEGRTSA